MRAPTILVAGAGPGLGMALLQRFAREGFVPAALVHPQADTSRWRELLPSEPHLIPADLGDPEALPQALHRVESELGFPDVLVYHAAEGPQGALLEIQEPELKRAFQVNVLSLLTCVRWARPAMAKAGRGSILITGGGSALAPKAGEGAAAQGKAAQRSLALTLAQELAPEGIHAATVTLAGWLQPGTAFGPEHAAEAFWRLHQEPRGAWQSEVVLRP